MIATNCPERKQVVLIFKKLFVALINAKVLVSI